MRKIASLGMIWLLLLATVAAGQGVVEQVPHISGEGSLPLFFSDHALLADAPGDFPVLMVGQMPEGIRGKPGFVANLEPAWNLLERAENGALAELASSGKSMRPAATSDSVVMLAAPKNENWMPTSLELHGENLVLQVNVWDRPAGQAPPREARRMAYLMTMRHLDIGTHELTLICDHFKPSEPGVYKASGERQTATMRFDVGAGPRGDGGGSSARLRESDLKTEHREVEQGPGFVPPLQWVRQVYLPYDGVPEPYAVRIAQMDARKYLDQMPARSSRNSVPPIAPLPVGEKASAETLCAVIMGPTVNSGEYVMLHAITSEAGGGYTIHMEVWRDRGGRRGNSPSATLFVVPLSFLPKGEQRLMVRWREYHAPVMLSPYELRDMDLAPLASFNVNLE